MLIHLIDENCSNSFYKRVISICHSPGEMADVQCGLQVGPKLTRHRDKYLSRLRHSTWTWAVSRHIQVLYWLVLMLMTLMRWIILKRLILTTIHEKFDAPRGVRRREKKEMKTELKLCQEDLSRTIWYWDLYDFVCEVRFISDNMNKFILCSSSYYFKSLFFFYWEKE